MERGIHAVFVALIRHILPGMKLNSSAQSFSSEMEGISQIRNSVLERVAFIDSKEEKTASSLLDEIIRKWESLATSYSDLNYYKKDGNSILSPFEFKDEDLFPTMNSLRNVDHSAQLKRPV